MNDTGRVLLAKVKSAIQKAYAPYSGFKVACGLLFKGGFMVVGVNVENNSSQFTICAERAALVKAVSEGLVPKTPLEAVIIYEPSEPPIPPCAGCCQFLAEFAGPLLNISVLTPTNQRDYILNDLLPFPYKRRQKHETGVL